MSFSTFEYETMRRRCDKSRGLEPEQPNPTGKAAGRERELHDDIENYCRMRGYLVCHSRMDMASTIAVGFPDFVVFMPGRKVCFLEAKARGGKATTEQLAKLAHARKLGFVSDIVDNLEGAVAAMTKGMNS